MDPTGSAFTPLATLHLPGPHVLHPQACNPTMDLVVLLGQGSSKGKAKVGSERFTKLTLWRMSGSRVWESDLDGRVRGLAWSHDGLYLTVLIAKPAGGLAARTMALEHFSVHTGELVKSIKLDITEAGPSSDTSEVWWDLRWTESTDDWPKPQRGSAGMIIDSLPRPTPVEPPQAANALPFMLPSATKIKKTSTVAAHAKLDSFPSLLPTLVPSPPHVLSINSPDRSCSKRLLTGTLPLGKGQVIDEQLLKLARSCDRLSGFIDIVLRGLESVGDAFKEGEKQTMIWREELESCGEQRGVSIEEVHAHLFQLLVTGRGSPAVAEWLGNRLTGRTIAKWEVSLETSYKRIQSVFAESVGPSIERVVLLLEEMWGWSMVYSHLGLSPLAVKNNLAVAIGFAKLIERMRQQAQEEAYAASEWIKWLKYEIGRTAAQDISTDTFLPSLCDTKLVWYFLKNGFVRSPLLVHFPQQFRQRPPDDILPENFDANPRPKRRSMSEVLAETIRSLTGRSKRAIEPETVQETPPVQHEESNDSSVDMTVLDESGVVPSSPDIPSSPDTVSQKPSIKEELEPPRVLELEPWVWANTLIASLKTLVKSKDIGREESQGWKLSEGALVDTRMVDGREITAAILPGNAILYILSNKDYCTKIALSGIKVLAISFFDDIELALLVELEGGERVLYTVTYAGRDFEKIEPITELATLPLIWFGTPVYPLENASPKFHHLRTTSQVESVGAASIALNGRTGRRVGCVMMDDGKEVEVLDMEGDDGEEEEEEDAQDGEAHGEGMSGIVEE